MFNSQILVKAHLNGTPDEPVFYKYEIFNGTSFGKARAEFMQINPNYEILECKYFDDDSYSICQRAIFILRHSKIYQNHCTSAEQSQINRLLYRAFNKTVANTVTDGEPVKDGINGYAFTDIFNGISENVQDYFSCILLGLIENPDKVYSELNAYMRTLRQASTHEILMSTVIIDDGDDDEPEFMPTNIYLQECFKVYLPDDEPESTRINEPANDVVRRFMREYKKLLTPRQLDIFKILYKYPNISRRQICKKLRIKSVGTLGEHLNKMQAAALKLAIDDKYAGMQLHTLAVKKATTTGVTIAE